MEQSTKINVIPNAEGELIIRNGEASVIRQDEPLVLTGDFRTIDRYLENRYKQNALIDNEIVGKESNCIFDYTGRQIRLYVKEEKYMKQVIIGNPSFSIELNCSTLPFLRNNEKGVMGHRFKIGFEAFREIILMNRGNITDNVTKIVKEISNPKVVSKTTKTFGAIKNFLNEVFIGSSLNDIKFKMPLFNDNWNSEPKQYEFKINIAFEFKGRFNKGWEAEDAELPEIFVDVNELNLILLSEIKAQIDAEFKKISGNYPALLTYKN